MATEEKKSGQVKLNQVCQPIFGITPRWYRELAKEGYVPFPIDGKIDFLPAVKSLLEYYRKQAEGGASMSLQEERKLKIGSERKLKDLEYLLKTQQLMPTSEFLNYSLQRINVMKSALMTFKRSLPPMLVGKDVRQMSEIIGKQVIHLLERISKQRKYFKDGSDGSKKLSLVA